MPARRGNARSSEGVALTFTPAKLAILIPYALVLWGIAYSTIHFRGPTGIFQGTRGLVTFALMIPVTIVLNWLHLKLTGLPKREIVNAVALTLAVATAIDAICFYRFPQVYGTDPEMLRQGAAFIIWAGAVACFLAFLTRRAADREAAAAQSGEE